MSKADKSEMSRLYEELNSQKGKTFWSLVILFLTTVGGVALVVYVGIVGTVGVYLFFIHILVGGFRWIFG